MNLGYNNNSYNPFKPPSKDKKDKSKPIDINEKPLEQISIGFPYSQKKKYFKSI